MFKRILVAAWLALFTALPALATSVLPLDLGQIIDQAAVAFQGTVTDVRSGRDPQTGVLVTMTTFRVDDVLKGEVAQSYTLKQIGGTDSTTGMSFRTMGMPTYKAGQTYVIFLHGVSSVGFTSPVGLGQGRFQVLDGETGPEVGNGRDFREMTENVAGVELPAQAKAKAAGQPMRRMGLADFKAMVRQHAGARK
jgi:hypothetical protein